MSVARDLARFLAGRSFADLPPEAVDYAAMLVASTVASAALGSGIESARIVRALARDEGGTPDASVWFDASEKLPVAHAARVNAMMSDAAASDDSDLRNIAHPGTPLVAASLALGQRMGSSGEEVLAALVLGYEATGRIGGAVTPGFREKGFHGCLVAIFGAAVASSRLLRAGEAELTQAIALAATSIGGIMAAANTSVAREYHAGLAAMLGVQAALAASKGYVAEETVFETRQGFFEIYGGGGDTESATRNLGDEWQIVNEIAIKLMPGGHPNHASAEAAASAATAGNVAPEEIDAIVLSRPGMTQLNGPRHPTDLIGVAHSPAYFVAAGAADRDFSWVHATQAKIDDPRIRRLLDLVEAGAPPTENLERYKQGASVTIRTKDGRGYTSTVFAPRGSGVRGVDWADVDAKYRALVPIAGLDATKVEASLGLIHDLRGLKDVSALTDLLR